MTTKKGEPAKFNGVLIPDLNYQNYKTLEALTPELLRLSEDYPQNCPSEFSLSPLIWLLGGVILGGLAVAKIK